MTREEARRSPGESDEGAASRPQGQNAPCADDFAAASGTDRFRACADSAGLAPDGVYVYAERGDGRRSRQPWSGSTVAATIARTLTRQQPRGMQSRKGVAQPSNS